MIASLLAQELKKRNNIEADEVVLGDVININPLEITILDNNVILNENLVYVCSNLKSLNGTCMVDGKLGNFVIDRSLKVGDKVACIPTAKGQKYVVVDKV